MFFMRTVVHHKYFFVKHLVLPALTGKSFLFLLRGKALFAHFLAFASSKKKKPRRALLFARMLRE